MVRATNRKTLEVIKKFFLDLDEGRQPIRNLGGKARKKRCLIKMPFIPGRFFEIKYYFCMDEIMVRLFRRHFATTHGERRVPGSASTDDGHPRPRWSTASFDGLRPEQHPPDALDRGRQRIYHPGALPLWFPMAHHSTLVCSPLCRHHHWLRLFQKLKSGRDGESMNSISNKNHKKMK